VNFNHNNCEIISTDSIPETQVSGIVTAEHEIGKDRIEEKSTLQILTEHLRRQVTIRCRKGRF
jgi:hypothetical protein